MEKLNRITIGDKQYPIKVDMNVLEVIQNEYGTINGFERDILGLRFIKDEEGRQLYDENKKPRVMLVEPSMKAIKFVLPVMINEGLAIEADETGTSFEPVREKEIFRECTMDFENLASFIHNEYKKCFVTKK